MALVSVVSIHPALGDPTDVFEAGNPVIGSAAPKAADIRVGDASVSPTGAFQYSHPIFLPPGRSGMAPHLSLSYSSQAPIYGGIAAGWTLSGLPLITLDTANGVLGLQAKKYTSSMAGGRPLVEVSDPHDSDVVATYRAQGDSSWTRYERTDRTVSYPWRARTVDGSTHYFGESDHRSNCTIVTDEYAPLTRSVDKFGNVVEYFYKAAPNNACIIDYITWGQNSGAGYPYHFAAVVFGWSVMKDCRGEPVSPPVGSQVSRRSGREIGTGTARLTTITAAAFAPGTAIPPVIIPTNPDHTRLITLAYDQEAESCTATHAAYRALASIQESAWGTDSPRVDLPAVRFTYGPATFGQGPLAWSPPQTPPVLWDPNLAGGNANYNLGWGYRFQNGQWPTVEAMMVDIDGDGLIDRLVNYPQQDASNNTVRCRAAWQRNPGGGQHFEAPQLIEMPTMKWASNTDSQDPARYNGGAYAGYNPFYQAGVNRELCALNYQLSGYVNSAYTGGGVVCPVDPNCGATTNWLCSTTHDDCSDKNTQATNSKLAFRWMDIDGDGKVDLVASPVAGGQVRYNLQHGNIPLPAAPWEPALFGTFGTNTYFPDCPNPTFTAFSGQPLFPADPNRPYTMCNGMFPWMVYRNKGQGVFGVYQGPGVNPLPDEIRYEPTPLESTSADSSITSAPVGADEGTVDVDGDGYADAVHATDWAVYRSDYQNGRPDAFVPAQGATPFYFGVPFSLYLTLSDHPAFDAPVEQVEGLLDLNGDGQADHWRLENGSPVVRLNGGTGFIAPTGLGLSPGSKGLTYVTYSQDNWIWEGSRTDLRHPVDIDLDGRVDIQYDPDQGGQVLQAYLNQGGQFISPAGVVGYQTSVQHRIVVGNQINLYWPSTEIGYSWEIRSDMMDLDGDGIPEGVDFGPYLISSTMALSKVPTPQEPPRLLAAINDQRGAITVISYAPTTDPTVVTQEPAANKTLPEVQWVVRNQMTSDFLDTPNTTAITSYHYTDPRLSIDDEGKYGFRGFEKIETTLPSGAVRDDRYDFTVDWTGRLTKSLMHPAEALSEVRTIDITAWLPFPLFNGVLTTYHAVTQEHLVCANGQTESTCTPSTAAGYARTSSTLTALASTRNGGEPLMYQETQSLLQAGVASADGDRRTDSDYYLDAGPTDYRLVSLSATKLVRGGGAFGMYAKTERKWTDSQLGDDSYRVPYMETVWVDTDINHVIVTRRDYDLYTGNVKKIWKPEQWAANPNPFTNLNRTTLSYDSRGLFATDEVNELGHEVTYTYEYGTGTKLATYGPNIPECARPPNQCGIGAPTIETHRIRVDGLGREIERWETFTPDLWNYSNRETDTTSYVDAMPNGNQPTYVTTRHLLNDFFASDWREQKTELDGHGRPIKDTLYTQGSAPADQITTYQYRDDGTVQAVSLPDPSANDASTVTYTYTFDSLGRPTGLRRPDATPQSGADLQYDGLSVTTTEVVGTDGGQVGKTVTHKDSFGRLVQVDELRTSPSTWATTAYLYDANDNVRSVTDPEGVATTMVHDFASRRTQITHGGQTWKYAYDRNGNLSSSQIPGSSGPMTDPDYTTTVAYDALDRPTSRMVARLALSAADRTTFASDSESYVWDVGPMMIGRLRYSRAFGPGAQQPAVETDNLFDAQGYAMQQTQSLQIASWTLSRLGQEVRYASGALLAIAYPDDIGDGYTQSTFQLDPRGFPRSVQIDGTACDGSEQLSVSQARNVAGLVTSRNGTTRTGDPVSSTWTYDRLGRVASQDIEKAISTRVARQDLHYFGNDDPSTLDHWLGPTNHKKFVYAYDVRHQLANVSETQLPNAFAATYTYGAAGRFMTASESAAALTGSDVIPRAVTYTYDTTDPERVTGLKKSNNKYLEQYTYDAAGNRVTRSNPTTKELWTYVYDGKNQLRRVTKKLNNVVQGSEEYYYDKDGARVATVKRDAGLNPTELVWWFLDTEAHYSTSSVTNIYTHVSMGTPVARINRISCAQQSQQQTVELQFHGLGNSTLAAVDLTSGATNAAFTYAPFGEVIEAVQNGAPGDGLSAHRRRFNDKFVDELSSLAYYGARYYDRTSMTWTQSDPLYRFVPDKTLQEPRRALLYTLDLNNPIRFADLDGRSPGDIVKGLRTISSADLGRLSAAADALFKSAKDFRSPAGLQATGAAVQLIAKTFHLGNGTPVHMVGPEDKILEGYGAIYTPNHEIYISSWEPQAGATGTIRVVTTAMIVIHELAHSEGADEPGAYTAMRRALDRLYQAGSINAATYKAVRQDIDTREAGEDDICLACIKIPEMHEDPSLMSNVYRQRTTPIIEGLWGLEISKDGPMATPSIPRN